MNFTPLFKPFEERPDGQYVRSRKYASGVFFRDSLTISAWLSLGGIATSALYFVIGRLAFLIPVVITGAKVTDTLLILLGLKQDPFTRGLIMGKFSAQLPNDDGTFGPTPAAKGLTLLLIGATVNHPLGLFAPGFKETGDFMIRMQKDINDRAEEYGLLGSSLWLAAERETTNGNMAVMYFKDSEGLHRYAQDALHREAWAWWNKAFSKYPYIHIWHEVYVVPARNFETVYVNGHPSLLSASTYPVKTPSGTQWLSTVVDANKGVLKSSKGRLTMTDGNDNDKYNDRSYGETREMKA